MDAFCKYHTDKISFKLSALIFPVKEFLKFYLLPFIENENVVSLKLSHTHSSFCPSCLHTSVNVLQQKSLKNMIAHPGEAERSSFFMDTQTFS